MLQHVEIQLPESVNSLDGSVRTCVVLQQSISRRQHISACGQQSWYQPLSEHVTNADFLLLCVLFQNWSRESLERVTSLSLGIGVF